MDAQHPSPPPVGASSQAASPLGSPSPVTEAPTGAGDLRVLFISGSVATVALGGQVYNLGLDFDGSAVLPHWPTTSPEADEALAGVDDDLLTELLTDAYIAQRRAEAA